MKSLKRFWMPGLMALLVFLGAGGAAAQPGPRTSFQTFYDELEPYGRWMPHARYGYVWMPDAGPDFQPYATNGHWVVTEYGNTWVSDYPWGWAAFHYGRWFYDDFYGWTWVPDQEWGPAWVSWRNGGGYYGWAPLGPGMAISRHDIPVNYWCFVPEIYIARPRVITFCVPRPRVVHIYRNSRHLDNIHHYQNRDYVYGPRREDIERVTRSRVAVYRVNPGGQPGRAQVQDRSLKIYRPEITHNQSERPQPRNLAGHITGNNRNGSGTSKEADETARFRMDRSAGMNKDAVSSRQERRTQPELTTRNRETSPVGNYPGRGARPEDPVISRENTGQGNAPAGVTSPFGRERVMSSPRISREQAATPDNLRYNPKQPPIGSAHERVSRGTTNSGEFPIRQNQGNSRQIQYRSRETASPDQGPRLTQPQRERPGEPFRGSQGRGRRE
jgi:hypothetical protein